MIYKNSVLHDSIPNINSDQPEICCWVVFRIFSVKNVCLDMWIIKQKKSESVVKLAATFRIPIFQILMRESSGAYHHWENCECIHAYMHTCIHAYMHTCMHAYNAIHAYMHTMPYMHTCIPYGMHTLTNTCIHAYMHTLTDRRESSLTWPRACLSNNFVNSDTLSAYKISVYFDTLSAHEISVYFDTFSAYDTSVHFDTSSAYEISVHFDTFSAYDTSVHFDTFSAYEISVHFDTFSAYKLRFACVSAGQVSNMSELTC